jgi:hypothetical protein
MALEEAEIVSQDPPAQRAPGQPSRAPTEQLAAGLIEIPDLCVFIENQIGDRCVREERGEVVLLVEGGGGDASG